MSQFRRLLVSALFSLTFLAGPASAAAPELTPAAPDHYVVRPGDTLWDISGRFLRDPWRWREVWEGNPAIDNPDLIYPGDVVWLSYQNGQPRLGLRRPVGGQREVKLQPHMRRETLTSAIPTIPIDAIQQFLTRPQVLSDSELESAPQIQAFVAEHIVGGAGDAVYVSDLEETDVRGYDVVRPGDAYRNPDTGEYLGREALYIGDAELMRAGDPAKLMLTNAVMQVQLGDRMLPDPEQEMLHNFMPKPAPAFLEAKIIAVLDGVNQIGQYNVVVVTAGDDDGLEEGDVMHILQQSNPPRGKSGARHKLTAADLPLEEVGTLMVFRVFDRVSYALVMRASSAIHLNDTVRSPET